jgi:hypothetical protein
MESKRNPIRKADPKIEAPQWLVDHMATAPKELQEYVFKVFPERRPDSVSKVLSGGLWWEETPEDYFFWESVDLKNWVLALVELRKKNLL